jgi:hypothetical protein
VCHGLRPADQIRPVCSQVHSSPRLRALSESAAPGRTMRAWHRRLAMMIVRSDGE